MALGQLEDEVSRIRDEGPLVATDAQAEWNVIMAGVVAAMLPPLLILILLQRSFVRSIALGQDK